MTKREKRRAKQKAKAEAEQAAGVGNFTCEVCSVQFSSKSKVRVASHFQSYAMRALLQSVGSY